MAATYRRAAPVALLVSLLILFLPGAGNAAAKLGPWQALVEVGQQIQVLDLQTGTASPVPGGPVLGRKPHLAPSRDYFCFLRASGGEDRELWLANFAGTQRRVYQCADQPCITAVAWWPDAHGVLIGVTGPGGRSSTNWRVLTVTPTGQTVQPSCRFEGVCGLCAFPDNRTVYVGLGYTQSTMVDLTTGRLWAAPSPADPKLSMWLAPRFCRADGRLYTGLEGGMSVAGEEQTALDTASLQATGLYSFQPDGRGLRRLPGVSGHRRADGARADVRLVDVSPDGRWLLFGYGGPGEEKGLWLVSSAGGTPKPVPGVGQTVSAVSWTQ